MSLMCSRCYYLHVERENLFRYFQVAIGTIVRGGPADLDGRLQRGDEIHFVDGINVIGAAHRRVISLMGNAALAGEVALGIHRNPNKSGRKY